MIDGLRVEGIDGRLAGGGRVCDLAVDGRYIDLRLDLVQSGRRVGGDVVVDATEIVELVGAGADGGLNGTFD